jgi:cytosine/adenosine deaminase-related metal-dependent hydrolase
MSEQAQRTRCDLLIRGGTVMTFDPAIGDLLDGAIAIVGNRIVAVGPSAQVCGRFDAARTIDACGALVRPGFIDAHYHVLLHLSRGVLGRKSAAAGAWAQGPGAFATWIETLTEEDEHVSTLLACIEMVRNGYTTFMEPGTVLTPDAAAEAIRSVGMRGVLADPYLRDIDDGPSGPPAPRVRGGRKRARALLGQQLGRNAERDGLVRGHVAIYGAGTCSLELMCEARERARAAGAVFAMHQSFSPEDHAFDRARFGRPPMVHYAELGLLGPDCTFTHLNAIEEAELSAIEASGMNVVWHPGNSMYYGFARQTPFRFGQVVKRGVSVALGNDVAKAWSFGDLPLIGYLLAREHGDPIEPADLLRMLTVGGARAVGRPAELGVLSPGFLADVVVARLDVPEAQPGFDLALHLALTSRSRAVDLVIVNGAVIVENGRCTHVDERAVYERARRCLAAMEKRGRST